MEASRDELTGRWTLSGVEPSEVTFERMCKNLREGINFKFARWGDGEFFCMAGKKGHNCDNHEYFPDLGAELREAFYSDPQYMVGIQPLSVSGGLYQKAIEERPGPKNIYDADVLHSASIDGKMDEFFDSMKGKIIHMIGPTHLLSYFNSLGFKGDFIEVSDANCWKEFSSVMINIYLLDSVVKNTVFLLCASMMSEVIIDRVKDLRQTFIDCGSVFDPYAGKLSRSYHHKLNLNGH